MTQANSISGSFRTNFGVPETVTGIVITVLAFLIILGGITSISRVSSVLVPAMALFYAVAGILVILFHIKNLPAGLAQIFIMAFCPKALGGGVAGTLTISVMNSVRYGVARGVFSNEAGLGSAAITAAAATSDHPVRQGYINMTGTFFDTIVVCTITGLAIASSGVLGTTGADGTPLQGVQLTMAAFSSVLGPLGSYLVGIGIILFAFSSILGWEYQGEKAFEYLVRDSRCLFIYRTVYSLIVFFGATQKLDLVWNLSDITNALMAIPNLICLLLLSGEIARDVQDFQPIVEKEKNMKKKR
jgi:AGCS family alanine or glycine:cation symporter